MTAIFPAQRGDLPYSPRLVFAETSLPLKRRLLRFGSRARRDDCGLERVERLHRKLALGCRIRGDVDRLTRRERLPLAVDVKHDGVVPGSANHADHQMTVADNPSYIGIPHREELRQIFDLAGITYGRIDYGLRAEKIQVWEINLNPTLIQGREKYHTDKLALKQQLVDKLSDAFLDVHSRANSISPRKVSVSLPGLLPIVGFRPRTRLRRLLFRRTL
jgi:hypothetical protein